MDPAPRLIRWSECQAGAMLAVIALVLAGAPLLVAALIPAVSFAGLIALTRGQWTRSGRFGAANAVTLLRFVLVLGVLGLSGLPQFALALFALALDGVDGWLARRLGLCSEFGECFDQETDAVFMLVLGLLLYRRELLGAWILVPGGLRYAFILFVKAAQPPQRKATGTFLGKAVCVAVLMTLMLCLLPVPQLRAPLALAATLALCGSFAFSLRAMYRPG